MKIENRPRADLLTRLKASRMVREAVRLSNRLAYLGRPIHKRGAGNRLIRMALSTREPQAIGKLGSTETLAIRKHLRTRGRLNAPHLAAKSFHTLYTNAGVFPDDYEVHARYCEYMLREVLPELTLLAVWFNLGEASIVRRCCRDAILLDLLALDPYRFRNPWWEALAGRRVLAVHPFSETIRRQHPHLAEVWAGARGVPGFALDCLRVPQHPTMVPPRHSDWFETLEELEDEMAARAFDVAIIGAGAYSLPLAVHAKRMGKQAIHLGGSMQIVFGIRGRRWDGQPEFERLFNEYWCRPLPTDTPASNASVEGGCYW